MTGTQLVKGFALDIPGWSARGSAVPHACWGAYAGLAAPPKPEPVSFPAT
jgi:hypothetical protein